MKLERGFSYLEVLLSVVLLGVLLVPALEALQSGISDGHGHSLAARQLQLKARMEEIAAKPFAALYSQTYLPGGNTTTSVNASLSDAVGAPMRRNVVLYRYDPGAAGLSAADTGVLFVAVYYAAEGPGSGLSTLIGRWW
jgi:type II secretory pathway pseudopilin PulG